MATLTKSQFEAQLDQPSNMSKSEFMNELDKPEQSQYGEPVGQPFNEAKAADMLQGWLTEGYKSAIDPMNKYQLFDTDEEHIKQVTDHKSFQDYLKNSSAFYQDFVNGWKDNFQRMVNAYGKENEAYNESMNQLAHAPNDEYPGQQLVHLGELAYGVTFGKALSDIGTVSHVLIGTPIYKEAKEYGVPEHYAAALGGAAEQLPFLYAPKLGVKPLVKHLPEPYQSYAEARANGLVGEEGLPGDKEPTAEDIVNRKAAANMAGMTTKPDIHTEAYKTAPEVFKEYDYLTKRRDDITDAIDQLSEAKKQPAPEEGQLNPAAQLAEEINKKFNFETEPVETGGTQALNLAEGINRRFNTDVLSENLLNEFKNINQRLRQLEPEVQGAYRVAANKIGTETVTEPAVKPAPEPVSNYIAEDMSKKFQAAGRPKEEADLLGQLLQAYYTARANRFEGKLGSPEELYDREAPEVVKGGKLKVKQGQEYNQNAPIFYSALSKGVEGIKQETASASQWLSTIKNLKGVKNEEIEWTGLENWLKEQPSPVTKSDIQQFLNEHQVQVSEIEHSGLSIDEKRELDSLNRIRNEYFRARRQSGLSLEEEQLRKELADRYTNSTTRFGQYVLSGSQNYKELLLTFPESDSVLSNEERAELDKLHTKMWNEQTPQERTRTSQLERKYQEYYNNSFRTPHWEEPNVLAHVRFDTRTGPNGEKVLHIAEIQSDWHQKGRKEGYKSGKSHKQINKEITDINDKLWNKYDHTKETLRLSDVLNRARYDYPDLWNQREKLINERDVGIPRAPFKTSWHEVVLKRMLRWAVDNGYDKLSWDTGETNADRFLKHIEEINALKTKDGHYEINWKEKNRNFSDTYTITEDKLPDYIGRDLASVVSKQEPEKNVKYFGLNLRVGEEGQKGFYDKILPNTMDKIIKKFDLKTKNDKLGPEQVPVHSVDLNNELKESVGRGLPLFQPGKKGSLTIRNGKNLLSIFEKADASTGIHEFGHQWLEDLKDDSVHPQATDEIKNNYQVVKNWLKVEDGASLTRAQHEKFARGVERYLMEGRAPSRDLANVFARFKEWLTQIYQTVAKLRAPINDDLRSLFDRLLRTEPKTTVITPEEEAATATEKAQEAQIGPEATPIATPLEKAASKAPRGSVNEIKVGSRVLQSKYWDKSGNLSLERMFDEPDENIVEALKEAIDLHIIPEIEEARGAPVTDADRLNIAQNLGIAGSLKDYGLNRSLMAIEKMFGEVNSSMSQNLIFVGKVINRTRQEFLDAAKMMDENPTDDQVSDYLSVRQTYMYALKAFSEAGTIFGRTGNTLRWIYKQLEGQRDLFLSEIERDTGKTYSQVVNEAKRIKQLMNKGVDNNRLSEFLRKSMNPTLPERILSLYTEWLISGTLSHIHYALANTELFLQHQIQAIPSAIWSKFKETILGKEIKPEEKIYLGEWSNKDIATGMYSLAHSTREGLIAGLKAEWEGKPVGWSLESQAEHMAQIEKQQGILEGTVEERSKAILQEVESVKQIIKDNGPTAEEMLPKEQLSRVASMLLLSEHPQAMFGSTPVLSNSLLSRSLDPIVSELTKFAGKEISANDLLKFIDNYVIHLPSRRIVAPIHTQTFVTSMIKNLHDSLYRQAKAMEAEAKINKEPFDFNTTLAKLQYSPPTDLVMKARNEAMKITFMARTGQINKILSAAADWAPFKETGIERLAELKPLRFLGLSFTHIPANVITEGMKISPGLNVLPYLGDLLGKNGDLAQAKAVGAVTTGMALLGTIYGMIYTGKLIVPPMMHSKEDFRAGENTGRRPYHLVINDTDSYDLRSLGAFGFATTNAVNMAQLIHSITYGAESDFDKEKMRQLGYTPELINEIENAPRIWLGGLRDAMTDTGPFLGLAQLHDAMYDESGNNGEKLFATFIKNLTVPYASQMSQDAKQVDPYQRYVWDKNKFWQSMLNEWQVSVPEFSKGIPEWGIHALPVKYDLIGNALSNPDFQGPYHYNINKDPVMNALNDLHQKTGWWPSPVPATIGGVALNNEEKSRYEQISGQLFHANMLNQVNSDNWKNEDLQTQLMTIRTALKSARKVGAAQVGAEFRLIKQRNSDLYKYIHGGEPTQ